MQKLSLFISLIIFSLSVWAGNTIELSCENGTIIANATETLKEGSKVTIKVSDNISACHCVSPILKVGQNEEDATVLENNEILVPRGKDTKTLFIICNEGKKTSLQMKAGFISSLPDKKGTEEEAPKKQLSLAVNGTIPLLDALLLAAAWKANDISQMKEILSRYGIKKNRDVKENCVTLKNYNINIETIQAESVGSSKFSDLVFSNSSGNVLESIFPATTIVDGLAKFTAKRFKEELTVAYLTKFKDTLSKSIPLQLLLPNTYQLLSTSDPFNYPTFIKSLHNDAAKDLQSLPLGVKNTLTHYKTDINSKDSGHSVYLSLMTMFQVIEDVQNRHPAVQIIETLPSEPYMENDKPIGITVNVLKFISQNLHGWTIKEGIASANDNWAENQYIYKLLTDDDVFNFWMALSTYKDKETLLKTVSFNNKNLFQYFNTTTEVKLVKSLAKDFVSTTNQLVSLNKIDELDNDTLKIDAAFAYIGSLTDLLVDATVLTDTLLKCQGKSANKIGESANLLRDVQKLVYASYKKEYGVMLSHTVGILTEIRNSINPPQKDSIIISTFLKYANLLVSISSAKTSDEVVGILETAALPAQSYIIKRKSKFNIALNSYPGLSGVFLVHQDSLKCLAVPSAPIGLSFSLGNLDVSKKGKGHSFSISIPVIDVGAVFAFRLYDNSTALSKIEWKNVFSPGAYLMWGIANSPISLGAGWQYGPSLTKVNSPLSTQYHRFGFTATVDVPLFNLYTNHK